MKLFDKFDRYLEDKEYKIIITKNRVNIINYLEVEDFSSKRVVVLYDGGKTILMGNDIVISKMLNDELLIMGEIESIVV